MTRLIIELPDELAVVLAERAKAAGHQGAEAYLVAIATQEAKRSSSPEPYEPHTWDQIEAKVFEALDDPSPRIVVTAEFWESIRRGGKERAARSNP